MAQMSNSRRAASASLSGLDWFWSLIRGHVVEFVGGPARTRVVVLFGCVLALSSAQISTVGAVAPTMEKSLHIDNTEIGLLNTVTLLVAAFAVLPIGLLVDKAKRIPMLSISIVLWSVTTILGALAGSYGTLLLSRVLLGLVSATAGPAIASLTGDYFPSHERARVYGYILTGEIAGTAVGFVLCGTIASALSWQAAFWVLAIPGFFLARSLWRTVPEPMRGGQSRLERGAPDLAYAAASAGRDRDGEAGEGDAFVGEEQELALRMAEEQGYKPDPRLILYRNPDRMSLTDSIRYIMRIPTNVLLIISSSLGYFFFAGLETFAVVFVRGHFQVNQATATLVLGVLVIGAVVGTLLSGPLTDLLTKNGHLSSRVWVPAICNIAAGIVLIPGFLTSSLITALPFCFFGTALISAANPPLDAARLDIMPPGLWGRAESVRTFLRSIAQAVAPLLFGGVSDLIAGFEPQKAPIGTHTQGPVSTATGNGLQITFLIMIVSLLAAGWFLWKARTSYASDVATAGASWSQSAPGSDGGGSAAAEGSPPPSGPAPADGAAAAEGERTVRRQRTRATRRTAPRAAVVDEPPLSEPSSEESTRVAPSPEPPVVQEPSADEAATEAPRRDQPTADEGRGEEEPPAPMPLITPRTLPPPTSRPAPAPDDEDVGAEAETRVTRRRPPAPASRDEQRRASQRVPEYDYDRRRRAPAGEPEPDDETRRMPGRSGEEETQVVPAEDDATEPLVRRRRPRPEWLRDREGEDGAEEPLVWPREPPPDR
jgi:MFS family permease